MNDWMFCRGGPRDGQVRLGEHGHEGYLRFSEDGVTAYYRLTVEVIRSDRGPIPVAEYVGEFPPTG